MFNVLFGDGELTGKTPYIHDQGTPLGPRLVNRVTTRDVCMLIMKHCHVERLRTYYKGCVYFCLMERVVHPSGRFLQANLQQSWSWGTATNGTYSPSTPAVHVS